MNSSVHESRREFLQTLGRSGAGAVIAATSVATASEDGARPIHASADQPFDPRPTAADLGSLFAYVQKLSAKQSFGWSFLGNRFKSLADFKQAARTKLFELLQYRPEKIDPKPEVLERDDQGDFIREKLLFSTTPEFRVPAYLLLPKRAKMPAPAIVDLHSHGGMYLFGKEKVVDLGDNHPVMTRYHRQNYDERPTATALARRGYVVITIDAFMFGERRTILDSDRKYGLDRARYSEADVQHLNQQCRSREATLVKSLIFAGLTWPGIVCWDDLRTVDYLLTRPEVDPKRIGCLGISMGGYRSAYLAALDERIAAACVVGFMSTVNSMLQAHVDIHSWVHFLPGLHEYLDWPDVVSLTAPKPLLVQQCSRDALFPLAGMKAAVDKIAAIYAKGSAPDRFRGKFYDVPHVFSRAMQDDAFGWFDRHLRA